MFDSNLLKPINQCKYTGVEAEMKIRNNHFGIQFFKDNFETVRVVSPDNLCGALLEKDGNTYLVKAIYTAEHAREKGLAKQLKATVEFTLKAQLHAGGNTTELGAKLFK